MFFSVFSKNKSFINNSMVGRLSDIIAEFLLKRKEEGFTEDVAKQFQMNLFDVREVFELLGGGHTFF